MAMLFAPGGGMDYQRTFGSNGHINKSYVDVGNYNYGVVTTTAGYSENTALFAAAVANQLGKGNKSGPLGSNPRNNQQIEAGRSATQSGTLCQ